MRTPKKKTDRIDVNYSPARLPKNIRTRAVPASQLGSSSTGGRIFQIARSGISSLHSMNPAYPNSKLQPFRRTSPMKLSRSSEIEPGQEKQIQYVSVASVASLSNSSIVTSSGTFPHSSIASNSFPVTSAKIESDRTFSEQYPSTSSGVKTEPLSSPRKNSINILRRRRISQKNNISKQKPQIVIGRSILGPSPSKSRRKQIL